METFRTVCVIWMHIIANNVSDINSNYCIEQSYHVSWAHLVERSLRDNMLS